MEIFKQQIKSFLFVCLVLFINCSKDAKLVEDEADFPGGGSNPIGSVDELPVGKVFFLMFLLLICQVF